MKNSRNIEDLQWYIQVSNIFSGLLANTYNLLPPVALNNELKSRTEIFDNVFNALV